MGDATRSRQDQAKQQEADRTPVPMGARIAMFALSAAARLFGQCAALLNTSGVVDRLLLRQRLVPCSCPCSSIIEAWHCSDTFVRSTLLQTHLKTVDGDVLRADDIHLTATSTAADQRQRSTQKPGQRSCG